MAKTVCYILKKDISECFTRGCLLNSENRPEVYTLHHPGSSKEVESCTCKDWDVSPVSDSDYPYIVKISRPKDRFDAFNRKLEWAKKLEVGSKAYVKLRRKPTAASEEYVQAVVKFKGTTKIGMKFGVEITVSNIV